MKVLISKTLYRRMHLTVTVQFDYKFYNAAYKGL